MIKSFLTGIRRASSNWAMILIMLLANILFAIPLAVPIFLLITQTAGGTVLAQRLYGDNFDAIWATDFINGQFPNASPKMIGIQLLVMLGVLGIGYLAFNTFLAGGIIEILASADRRFSVRRFWGGCGAYFWRFFRLMLISAFAYGVAVGIYVLLELWISSANSRASAVRPTVMREFAALVLLLFLLSIVNMVFDYARIGTVIHDRRGMFRETFRGAGFAFRHFISTFGLYVLLGITGLILFGLFFSLREMVHQSSLGAIVLAVVIGEAAMVSRMWTRLAYYASQIDLYQSLVPLRVPETPEHSSPNGEPSTEKSQPPESAIGESSEARATEARARVDGMD